jgi:fatty-acyl-CoA synthase
VAKPDVKWGESPVAFVELKVGATATQEDLILHCKSLLALAKVWGKRIAIQGQKTRFQYR